MGKVFNIVNNLKYIFEFSETIYIVNSIDFRDDLTLKTMISNTYTNVIINNDVSPEILKEYRKNNPDLSHFNEPELINHFLTQGRHENRFDRKFYFVHFLYSNNTQFLCYDKYVEFAKCVDISSMDSIMVTNDSFLITRSLTPLFELHNNGFEMVGIQASNEVKYHYTDYLRIYSNFGFKKLIAYINGICANFSPTLLELIVQIEVNSTYIFNSKSCLYDVEPDYNGNINFDDEKYANYLNDFNYPIVKYKKLKTYSYDSLELPLDFNGNLYKIINPDLADVADPASHFINHGIKEKRSYKNGQIPRLPQYLKEYMNNYVSKNRDVCFYNYFD